MRTSVCVFIQRNISQRYLRLYQILMVSQNFSLTCKPMYPVRGTYSEWYVDCMYTVTKALTTVDFLFFQQTYGITLLLWDSVLWVKKTTTKKQNNKTKVAPAHNLAGKLSAWGRDTRVMRCQCCTGGQITIDSRVTCMVIFVLTEWLANQCHTSTFNKQWGQVTSCETL